MSSKRTTVRLPEHSPVRKGANPTYTAQVVGKVAVTPGGQLRIGGLVLDAADVPQVMADLGHAYTLASRPAKGTAA